MMTGVLARPLISTSIESLFGSLLKMVRVADFSPAESAMGLKKILMDKVLSCFIESPAEIPCKTEVHIIRDDNIIDLQNATTGIGYIQI